MSIKTRLKKLEGCNTRGGRCPLCCDRKGQVTFFAPGSYSIEEYVQDRIPVPQLPDGCQRCPFGWQPDLLVLVCLTAADALDRGELVNLEGDLQHGDPELMARIREARRRWAEQEGEERHWIVPWSSP